MFDEDDHHFNIDRISTYHLRFQCRRKPNVTMLNSLIGKSINLQRKLIVKTKSSSIFLWNYKLFLDSRYFARSIVSFPSTIIGICQFNMQREIIFNEDLFQKFVFADNCWVQNVS